jgi:hypothetical protein
MESKTTYVSEHWLRTYVHEHGNEAEDENLFGSHRRLRLAEARATLRHERRNLWRQDLRDLEEDAPA